MHRKTDINELYIPHDDVECWNRYPKHRWVYDLSRVLDAQNIRWSPWSTPEFKNLTGNLNLETPLGISYQTADIHFNLPDRHKLKTEVFIIRGDVKHLRHINPTIDNTGDAEIRIIAFVSMHFHKFTGVITIETYGSDIFFVALRPLAAHIDETDTEVVKLLKRIYKKSDVSISGPSDQVLHETLAS
jgi:hypothetical protein